MIEIFKILDVVKHLDGVKAVIFDLDDTLYAEKDYVKSGFKEINMYYPEISYDELWQSFINKGKPIDEAVNKRHLENDKEKILDIYRNHRPDIRLYEGVYEMLTELKKDYKLGLITDGRPVGQRMKIEALKIEDIFDEIVITDELGGIEYRKPNDISFKLMSKKFNTLYKNMVYIGDNLNKDFVAPLSLGMKCIHFNNEEGLYR